VHAPTENDPKLSSGRTTCAALTDNDNDIHCYQYDSIISVITDNKK